MSRFIILLGGKLVRTPRLDAQAAGARVIAADGGMNHAKTLGITPELWVGDFDSVTKEIEAEFAAVPQKRYPHDKDNTDGELAVAEALARGATSLVLAGAFGGRAPIMPSCMSRWPSGAPRKACRSSSPAAIRKPIRCCRARATSTSTTERFSASSASRTCPACP